MTEWGYGFLDVVGENLVANESIYLFPDKTMPEERVSVEAN